MEFNSSQSIYLQIADYVCERILLKEWKAEDKVPSVRELAVQLEVNPNTVMRTYDWLQQSGIIFNQRGIGFFVSSDGPQHALAAKKKEFMEKDLPVFFRNLYLLGMKWEDLREPYQQFKQQFSSK
ncbi:MAG TPA: GntR family transcriptional regulator [Dinghuibacter sp.]|uniref:GntR family transcriptional regulator n=1 Tax=Dinghuibacter sp. TaxID=2024697 RepID=UPI002BA0C64D|nr:GntR family transcriptional regulator [Dinghuibacter sp.]HTJ12450.1 GntR family transcriptional regulator [Dinghuibacter sp.]